MFIIIEIVWKSHSKREDFWEKNDQKVLDLGVPMMNLTIVKEFQIYTSYSF